jgi:2-polyprenyl-3-methyl-5-hydroxy-6-metoxy-1,4-benzoquinol methylase
MTEEQQLQTDEYEFPYHYIPHFDARGVVWRTRQLDWGLDYLCYLRHVADLVHEIAPRSLLDVGCGDGFFLGFVGHSVPRRCGVDAAEVAIRFAQAFHPDVDYRAADAATLDESFEVVTAIEVLEHVPDTAVAGFVDTLCARLHPGGTLIVSVPSTSTEVQAKHFRHYDEQLLAEHIPHEKLGLEPLAVVRLLPRRDLAYQLYRRLTMNGFWTLEVPWLNRWMWRHVWSRRFDAERGRKIIATYRKAQQG